MGIDADSKLPHPTGQDVKVIDSAVPVKELV